MARNMGETIVIGSNGQLGTDLMKSFPDAIGLTHDDLDITDPESLRRAFDLHDPDLVMNTAAFHNVPVCEEDARSAFGGNALGPLNLAAVCKEHGAVLVHFSTDYVFGHQSKQVPITEDVHPDPLNVYGISKLAGEQLIRKEWDRHFIIRTAAIYGTTPCRAKKGVNFVELMLKFSQERDHLEVVDDQTVSPTYTVDLAPRVKMLAETAKFGTYHMVCEGEVTWYDFAQKILELSDIDTPIQAVSSERFKGDNVKRPNYSVLSNRNLTKLGITMPTWEESLRRYLEDRKH